MIPFDPSAERYCTQCAQRKSLQLGGMWKPMNNGRNRRWLCHTCMARYLSRRSPEKTPPIATG